MTALAFLKPQLTALVEEGWEVHLACGAGPELADLTDLGGVQIHLIPMSRDMSPLRDLHSLFRWYQIVRELKPDLIVGSTPKAAFLSMLAGKWNHVGSRVYHARGFRAEGLKGIKRKIALTAEKVTSCCATAVLCDSHSLKMALQEAGVLRKGKGIVLGNGSCCGVDTDHFRPPTLFERMASREFFGLGTDDFVVGFVGRITKDKGVGELLQAVRHVNAGGERVKLVIVGPIEDDGALLSGASDNESITIAGPMFDVRSAYWSFDAFCLPSYREGFGNVNIEAQACGLPVVTTDTTGCRDSQDPKHSILTVPAKDPKELARAIVHLLNQEGGSQKMGKHARQWVVHNFNSQVVLRRQLNFLKEQL